MVKPDKKSFQTITVIAFILQKEGVGKSILVQALSVLLINCDSHKDLVMKWRKFNKIPFQLSQQSKGIWPLTLIKITIWLLGN